MEHLDVVVIVAYHRLANLPSELAPWRERYDLLPAKALTGSSGPLYTDGDGLGVLSTGVGKVAASTSTLALVLDERVDVEKATFISVGIAGGPPPRVDLGDVVVADAIVDWDAKLRWDDDGDGPPLDTNPYLPSPPVYRLDRGLVEKALDATDGVDLADGSTIRRGVNVCGDELWHGAAIAAQVDWLVDRYDVGRYLVTEMEDAGTAVALDRLGRLDRYLSIRGVANFDRPTDETPARDHLRSESFGREFTRGRDNAATVGAAVVDSLR